MDIPHKPFVEILHEHVGEISYKSVGGISHEPVEPNNSFHGNLDLNILIKDKSYEYQPSFSNEPESTFLEEGSSDLQPTFLGEGLSQL